MASSEVKTIPIRISLELKKQLAEYKHPGQRYNGFIEEILIIAREATDDFIGVRSYIRSAQKQIAKNHSWGDTNE